RSLLPHLFPSTTLFRSGGDLNNAIVYVDKEPSKATMEKLREALGREDISIRPNGIIDNLTLHHPNEAARHKLLDVIGDLALIGTDRKSTRLNSSHVSIS